MLFHEDSAVEMAETEKRREKALKALEEEEERMYQLFVKQLGVRYNCNEYPL